MTGLQAGSASFHKGECLETTLYDKEKMGFRPSSCGHTMTEMPDNLYRHQPICLYVICRMRADSSTEPYDSR